MSVCIFSLMFSSDWFCRAELRGYLAVQTQNCLCPLASIRHCVATFSPFFYQWHVTFYFLYFLPFWAGLEPSPLLLRPLLPYRTCPDDGGWRWMWNNRWNSWQGKPKYSEKTCRSSALSTTNPMLPDPSSIPTCNGGKPATALPCYFFLLSCFYFMIL
jgi:hypothetical protein